MISAVLRTPLDLALAFALLVMWMAAPPVAAQSALPKILVIGTGGTISGVQPEPGTLGSYNDHKQVNQLVSALPVIAKYAQVESEEFLNIGSNEITTENWLNLARRINKVITERKDLSGIVVTHGTATLTQTAFFLYLTIKSDMPVVILGAQRPSTGISADGPLNLLSAIRVAASPDARGKGVLVVMDERIMSARDTQKYYGRSGGFDTGEMGMLGVVNSRSIEFFYAPTRRHAAQVEFDLSSVKTFPRVDLEYGFVGSGKRAKTDARAIVVATTLFTPDENAYFTSLQKQGVIVATTFPSGDNVSSAGGGSSDGPRLISIQRMTPIHARILMMVALTKTQDPEEIQRIFNEY
jgi:L-asparaginase